MDKRKPRSDKTVRTEEDSEREARERAERSRRQNPPFTTTGKVSAPKFGSAGSGGAEIEPGPERD